MFGLPTDVTKLINSYTDKRVERFCTFHWKSVDALDHIRIRHKYPHRYNGCIRFVTHFPCSGPSWYTIIYAADFPLRFIGSIEPGLVVRYAY